MNDKMIYKGFTGSIEYNGEDKIFHGKIEGIRDLINYHAVYISALKKVFESSVDDYLKFCVSEGKEVKEPPTCPVCDKAYYFGECYGCGYKGEKLDE